jgi:CRP-like cAMP-binding protein
MIALSSVSRTTARRWIHPAAALPIASRINLPLMPFTVTGTRLANSFIKTKRGNNLFSTSTGSQALNRRFNAPRSGVGARRKKSTLNHRGTADDVAASSEQLTFAKFQERLNLHLNKPRTIPIPRWISPERATISLSECFGHGSFILVAISYAVDDFVQLRLIAIAGSSAMLVFAYFHPHGRVLWLPFKWNVLFIALNAYRVLKIHVDRFFASQLSPLMKHIHDHHFYVMDTSDFARLMRLGHVQTFKKGELVIQQNHENRHVRLVLQGTLNVERDGVVTYQMHEGNFISETGLHAGLLLRGNVTSCCDVIANDDDVVVLTWDRTDLMHLLEVDKNMQKSMKAVMSWDIVSKLKSQRVLMSSGLVSDPEAWTIKRREQTLHRYKSILSNMLAHPQYLNKRKEELTKYRDIHHISDDQHEYALKEMGWSLEEFEAGCKEGQVDEDVVEMQKYGWKWYAQSIYFRLFG